MKAESRKQKVEIILPDMAFCRALGWVADAPPAPPVRKIRPKGQALTPTEYTRLRRAKFIAAGLTAHGNVRKRLPQAASVAAVYVRRAAQTGGGTPPLQK